MAADEAVSNTDWATVRADDGGRPVILRIRTGLRDEAEFHQRWPNRMAVVWHYAASVGNLTPGLPTPDEQSAMTRFEEAAVAGLDGAGVAMLTSVVTSVGEREWVWYCGPTSDFNRAFNSSLRGHPRYPVALHVAPDAGWRGYRALLKAVGL